MLGSSSSTLVQLQHGFGPYSFVQWLHSILTDRLCSDPAQQYSNVSSGGKDPIPDGRVLEDDEQIKATVEIKTHRALLSESTSTKKQTFAEMLTSWADMQTGRAIKFDWPGELLHIPKC